MNEQKDISQEGLDKMRNEFQKKLKELHISLIDMGQDCQDIIRDTYQALIKNDLDVVEGIRKKENKINHSEREIENQCIALLLLQAPVAKDLRQVSSALEMVTDMERIGDQAYDIADIVKKNNDLSEMVEQLPLRDMVKQAIKMVDEAIQSFVNNDRVLAKQVIDEDDIIDGYFETIYNDLATKGIDRRALDLLMIAKYYERIGDHATNIAEWVLYEITAHQVPIGEK
jgi:phosphate transport system protein